MAGSSTNKEPVFIDRPLLSAVRLDVTSHAPLTVDPGSSTQAALVINTNGTDGCLIESLELLQRTANDVTPILLFLSTSDSFVATPDTTGKVSAWFLRRAVMPANQSVGATTEIPLCPLLSPVPHASTTANGPEPSQFRGLRLPAGIHLWAAAQAPAPVATAPQIIAHGGWF